MEVKIDQNNLPDIHELLEMIKKSGLSMEESRKIVLRYKELKTQKDKQIRQNRIFFKNQIIEKYGIVLMEGGNCVEDTAQGNIYVYDSEKSSNEGLKKYFEYVDKKYSDLVIKILYHYEDLDIKDVLETKELITPFDILLSDKQYQIYNEFSEKYGNYNNYEEFDKLLNASSKISKLPCEMTMDFLIAFGSIYAQENVFRELKEIPKQFRNKEAMCRFVLANGYMYSGKNFFGLQDQFVEILENPILAYLNLENDSRRLCDIPMNVLLNKKFLKLLSFKDEYVYDFADFLACKEFQKNSNISNELKQQIIGNINDLIIKTDKYKNHKAFLLKMDKAGRITNTQEKVKSVRIK